MLRKNLDSISSIALTLLFFLTSLWLAQFHEMWRDELQAWLLARDSYSIFELLRNLKYEGHPGLWHLLLFPLAKASDNPTLMQYLHALIATASVFLIFRCSPFGLVQKVLLAFGYFFLFEYSLIARNYAVGVFFIFVLCALFPVRARYPLLFALSILLLCHTSVFGLIFGICVALTVLLEAKLRTTNVFSLFRTSPPIACGVLLVVLGIFTSIFQLVPPSDSGFASGWRFYPSVKGVEDVAKAALGAYFPIPKIDLNFWNSKLILSNSITYYLSLALFIFIVQRVARFLSDRPSALFLYISVSMGIAFFFYVKYIGSLRHHGFFYVALVASLWIYRDCAKTGFVRLKSRIKETSSQDVSILFTFIASAHVVAAVIAVSFDYKYPFSGAQETALFLERRNLSSAEIIGHTSYAASAVAGYMKGRQFYYVDAERYGTFVRWDKTRKKEVNLQSLHLASLHLAAANRDVVLVLNSPIDEMEAAEKNFKKVFESSDSIVKNEKFYVYFLTTAVSQQVPPEMK